MDMPCDHKGAPKIAYDLFWCPKCGAIAGWAPEGEDPETIDEWRFPEKEQIPDLRIHGLEKELKEARKLLTLAVLSTVQVEQELKAERQEVERLREHEIETQNLHAAWKHHIMAGLEQQTSEVKRLTAKLTEERDALDRALDQEQKDHYATNVARVALVSEHEKLTGTLKALYDDEIHRDLQGEIKELTAEVKRLRDEPVRAQADAVIRDLATKTAECDELASLHGSTLETCRFLYTRIDALEETIEKNEALVARAGTAVALEDAVVSLEIAMDRLEELGKLDKHGYTPEYLAQDRECVRLRAEKVAAIAASRKAHEARNSEEL